MLLVQSMHLGRTSLQELTLICLANMLLLLLVLVIRVSLSLDVIDVKT